MSSLNAVDRKAGLMITIPGKKNNQYEYFPGFELVICFNI